MGKKIRQVNEITKERNSIFDYNGEFSNEKNQTYLLLIKHLLDNNEIKIIKVENDNLIGNYKKIGLHIKCLFEQECYMIMENEVRKFERECDKQRIGFLVSNVYISDEAIKRIENNDRMYLCHENEIVDVIKNVEKHIHNINDLIEEFEFYNELQKEIVNRQELLIKQLKEIK
ncbi:21669_t:CDS:2 [Cetraspora pellucida]|uniref:21669_t:CDS:1 n=1 Tax=Cetraspora pellucida TaxID=1433469 RepID=A0A9N9J4T4_9GLOM|nr:21669_t:CDS:2 [Cetraspora pellucida]